MHVVVKPGCKSRKYLVHVHVEVFSVRLMAKELCMSKATIILIILTGGRRMQPKFGAGSHNCKRKLT